MNTKASAFKRYLSLFLCTLVGYLIVTGFLIPTWFLLKDKWAVTSLLRHATSVKLEHFDHVWMGNKRVEKIVASKELAPADFHLVSEAFPLGLDISFLLPLGGDLCGFSPHHRIFITDAKGAVTIISVCFECDHYEIGDDAIMVTPFLWQHSFRSFFAAEGMPENRRDQ